MIESRNSIRLYQDMDFSHRVGNFFMLFTMRPKHLKINNDTITNHFGRPP